jgi:DNA-directed RNA polymerase alpha subunit
MDKFRARIRLNTRNGIIEVGDIVPDSYPRMKEAISRRWVEPVYEKQIEANPSALDIGKEKEKEKQEEESKEIHIKNELEMEVGKLPWIHLGAIKALAGVGIKTVADLDGWTEESLAQLKGIGKKTADKLVDIFQDSCALVASQKLEEEIKDEEPISPEEPMPPGDNCNS